jgi:hypothetical protein
VVAPVGHDPTSPKGGRFSYHYSFHYHFCLWSGLYLNPRLSR